MLLGKVGWFRFAIMMAFFQVVLLTGCANSAIKAREQISHEPSALSSSTLLLELSLPFLALAEANDDFLRNSTGRAEWTLPDKSLAGVKRVARQAESLLQALNAITDQPLSHEDTLTAAMLRRDLELLIEAPDHHWLYFDVTPYNSGYVMSAELAPSLETIDLAASGGVQHYLSLLSDSGRFVNDLADKLQEQKRRGILLPKAAIPGVRAVYLGLRNTLMELTLFDPSRLEGMSTDQVHQLDHNAAKALQEVVYPAIDRLLETLGDHYLAQAPEAAGLYQYPGGEAYYKYLIRRETTLDLSPDQIHQAGIQAMKKIKTKMLAIRQKLGFTGTEAEFHRQLRGDKNFYARSPE